MSYISILFITITSSLYSDNLTIIKDEKLDDNMHKDYLYNRAQERVDEKIKFYRHLFSYVVIVSLLFLVNIICTPKYLWVLWVILFWGIGILFDFLKVFVIYENLMINLGIK